MAARRSRPPSVQLTEPEATLWTTTLKRAWLWRLVHFGAEVGLGVDQGVDVAEPVVAMLHEVGSRLPEQRLHVPVQRLVERGRGGLIVGAGATLGFQHHLLDHAHAED